MVQLLNIRKTPAFLLPSIRRQLDCHMDTTQPADCSADLQSVLKAVALFFSFTLGIGLQLQKNEIAHISENRSIKKATIWVPTNTTKISQFLQPFQTAGAHRAQMATVHTGLLTGHQKFCSGFSSRFWSEILRTSLCVGVLDLSPQKI